MAVRVLVVDEDAREAARLQRVLQGQGFTVDLATSGARARHLCSSAQRPHVVLLASALEDMPGTSLCRELRQGAATAGLPIIVLSAHPGDMELVVAFELGTDDYLTCPFDERELVLRIRALVCRCYPNDSSVREVGAGSLRLDRESHRAWNGDIALSLTKVEFRLLEVLMSRQGRGQSREQLLQDVWGKSASGSLRTVDTHVRRLREKLGDEARYIRTVRGVGYRFGGDNFEVKASQRDTDLSLAGHTAETKT